MNNNPIGIFDSGLGGLTVVKEVRALLPFEDIIYFGDTARVPYGGKSRTVVRRFSLEISNFLQQKGVKLIVVACNTASSLAISYLRHEIDIPVIGVIEPGVRAAIKSSANGKIGVIGTKGTISSAAYQSRILRLKNDADVIAKPCPLFVPLVEENLMDSEITKLALDMYLKDFKTSGVQSLILACTHYPLLKKPINNYFEGKVKLIDSATETAIEVKQILQARRIESDNNENGCDTFYVSDSPDTFCIVGESFLGKPMSGNCYHHGWQQE